jgi:hypothetical protein
MVTFMPRRSAIGLVIFAGLSCSAAGPPDADGPSQVSFGKRGEGRGFASVCRYEVVDLPPTLSIFRFTVEEGGLTCFTGRHGVLFAPQRGSSCPQPPGVPTSPPQVLSQDEAAADYLQCSAMTSSASTQSTGLTIYRPNPAHAGSDDTFIGFFLDVGALVGNDMLPVTSLMHQGDRLCMESPDAHRVARRIAEADIAEPSEFLVEFGTGSCRDALPDAMRP